MSILRVASIGLVSMAALGCGGSDLTFTEPSRMPIVSFMPTAPRLYSGGTPVPSYAGVWVGQIAYTGCRTRSLCKYSPIPRPVTLRLSQTTVLVTGSMSADGRESPINGYVGEDGAFFSPMTSMSDGAVRLERAGDGLAGMKVDDLYQDTGLVHSVKHEMTGLRRVE
jgi:hypothetical protein